MLGTSKNPKYFPNPEKFNPERFSEKEIKSRPAYSFIPFSGGPRKCIGYKFAMMMILNLSAKLLRNYVFETKEKLEDIVLLPYITITPEKPIKFLIKTR
ncbi:Cytochrome P450 4V2, partial [Orchesella cincta]